MTRLSDGAEVENFIGNKESTEEVHLYIMKVGMKHDLSTDEMKELVQIVLLDEQRINKYFSTD